MITTKDFQLLIKSAIKYYQGEATELTDADYDRLLKESGIKDISVYLPKSRDEKEIPHPFEVPRFPKSDDWSGIAKLVTYEKKVITPKWDGCSIAAYYNGGKLAQILTKSNLTTGKNKFKMLKHKVPDNIDPRIVAIYFEALVPMRFSTGRANANGLINSVYKQDEVDQKIVLEPFDSLSTEPMTYSQRMNLIGTKWFSISNCSQVNQIYNSGTLDISDSETMYADGIVIYDDSLVSERSDAMIFKLHSAKESAITTVVKEVLQVSENTGLLTPKYMLEPVVINNITVKCVGNVGSIPTIEKKGLGIGSQVRVHLAKAVIPQIEEILTKGELPKVRYCPKCGKEVEEFQGKFICTNSECEIWKDRYNRVEGNKLEFIKPPRTRDSSWMENPTNLQLEYIKVLADIWTKLKAKIEEEIYRK